MFIFYMTASTFWKACTSGMSFNHKNTRKRMKYCLKSLPKSNSFNPCGRLYKSIFPMCHFSSIYSVNLYVFWNLLRQTRWLRHQMIKKKNEMLIKMLKNLYSCVFQVLPLHSRISWWCGWLSWTKKEGKLKIYPQHSCRVAERKSL